MPAKISGRERVSARLSGMGGERAVRMVGQALFAGGEALQTRAQQLITEGSVSGNNHVPSLPGEPPNNDSGVLKGNIEVTQIAPLQVEVSSNAPYAVELEAGTSKMAERPYMRPATKQTRKQIIGLVRQAVNRATKEV